MRSALVLIIHNSLQAQKMLRTPTDILAINEYPLYTWISCMFSSRSWRWNNEVQTIKDRMIRRAQFIHTRKTRYLLPVAPPAGWHLLGATSLKEKNETSSSTVVGGIIRAPAFRRDHKGPVYSSCYCTGIYLICIYTYIAIASSMAREAALPNILQASVQGSEHLMTSYHWFL